MILRFIPVSLIALSLALTLSCGGGGGGSSPAPIKPISSISPASSSTAVVTNAPIIITFNSALDSGTKGSVALTSPALSFAASDMTVSGSTVTIDPASDFAASTKYTGITVKGFKDSSGNSIDDYTDSAYNFTTGTAPDNTPPTVSAVTPADGTTDVPLNSAIVIAFSEPLGAVKGTVAISSPSLSFSGSQISVSGNTVTVTPSSNFAASTAHSGITVSGFADASGNTMTAYNDASYGFTTGTTIAVKTADVAITPSDNSHGTLVVSKSVTLTCTTASSTIRYTTDGSTPSRTNGTTYSVPFKVDTDCTVKAFAYSTGLTDSNVTSTAVSFTVPLSNHVADWRDQSIYFMLTDRFNDGDSLNNQQMSSTYDGGDFVAGDGKKYQGGDFAGITAKLDYLKDLGISAIWITSPVKQVWNNATWTGYHGYWAQDFMSVDPHLGTMADFRTMVYEAHSRGISVIMDVVVNHAGSLFYYDLNNNGTADTGEWEPAYNESGYNKSYLKWLEGNDWADAANRKKPMPVEFQNTSWWSFRGGNATTGSGNEVLYGDFAGLRDIDTTNTDVRAKFKEIFKWWIKNTDIDGIRIDTVKHVETGFWETFCADLRTWAKSSDGGNKNFYMLAEVYDGTAANLGAYTTNDKLDSVLGFNMAEKVFDWNSGDNVTVFKDAGTWSARPKTSVLESALSAVTADTNLNGSASIHTNGDGLTARQKMGYFIDNHDLNRFLNGTSGTSNDAASSGEVTNLKQALSWLLTWEGIPVIYYGTEQNYKQSLALTNHGEQGDGDGNCEKGNRPRLWQIKNGNNSNTAFDETNSTFKLIQGLLSLRKTYPELGKGQVAIRWTDSSGTGQDAGIFAFIKKGYTATTDDDILIVINTNSVAAATGAGTNNDLGTDWPVGTTLTTVQIPGYDSSQPTINNWSSDVTEMATSSQSGKTSAISFKVPANSIRILKKK